MKDIASSSAPSNPSQIATIKGKQMLKNRKIFDNCFLQIIPEKIENWKKVVSIMNGIKVRKAEQKILTEIGSGHLASRVMKLPVVSDRMLQESEDENETSKKNSLAEEAKIREHFEESR